jgi:multiple sugar transport system substrate-binding protein
MGERDVERTTAPTRRELLALCLGTPTLAGCLSTDSADSRAPPSGEDSQEETIELWHQETQLERRERMHALAEQFEDESGPEITIEAIDSQELLVEYELTAIEDAFTLAQFNNSQLDFIREDGNLSTETAGEVVSRGGVNEFYENILSLVETADGYFGVPFFVWVQGPWYRASAFEAAGIDMTPRSWDDLLTVAEALHAPEDQQYGIIIGEGAETEYATHCYTQLALANDTPLFSPDGEILFDTDPHVETLEFYSQLAEYTPPATVTPQHAFEAFLDGRCHFGLYPTHLITYVWNNADNKVRAVEDLQFAGYLEESRRSAYGLMNYLVFNDTASDDELTAAQEFAEFLLFDDDYDHYVDWLSVQIGGFQPVFEGFHQTTSYRNTDIVQAVDDRIIQDLIPEGINQIERFGGIVHDEYFPIIGDIEGQFLISEAINRVLQGETARTVAEETADRMRALRE